MARLSNILRSQAGGRVAWWCPGCDAPHAITVEGPSAWTWDRNAETPTFSPSVLTTGTRMTVEGEAMLARGESPTDGRYPSVETRCHSFMKGGQMEFLSDCTHALAGQTVPISRWPESFGDGDFDV